MYNSTMTNTFPYGYGNYNIGGSTLPQQGGRQMQPPPTQTQNQSPFLDKNKQAAAAYRNIQNPQQYIQNEIMKNNPLMKNVMEEIQANNGNAQTAFYSYAQKMGVNPNEILNMMKGQQ